MKRLRLGLVVPGFVATRDDPGMPAVVDLVERLVLDHDVRLLALRHPPARARYTVAGAEVQTLGIGGRLGAAGRAVVLARGVAAVVGAHRRRALDVVHGLWADEAGAVATLAGRLIRRPAVVSIMGGELVGLPDIGYGAALGRGGRATAGIALRLADVVTAGSTLALRQAQPSRGGRPMALLPLGVDVARFRPPDSAPSAGAGGAVLFVGSLEPVKDPASAIRAFARLAAGRPDLRLDIVGGGALRSDLEQLAASLGIGSRVRFAGQLPRDAMPEVYRSARVLLVTSRHEGQSMAAVEAAASGLPVAGTQVGVLPDFDGGALTVAPGDDSALAGALASIVDDPARADAMGAANRALAVARYDIALTSAGLVDLYRSLSRQDRA